jgi:DNA-binding IclR family transcriptional regulator
MLAESRRCGVALNLGRMMPDMAGVGVPILSADGQPVAAISAAAIVSRMDPQRRANIAVWLREEAERLQGELAPLLGALPGRSGRDQILGG